MTSTTQKTPRQAGLLLAFLAATPLWAQTDGRPNIVWFMMEDVSPQFMAAYNNGVGARTPNFDRLAREGLLFDNAYSCAPVSSAARSTLITGCYAPRLGLSFHRTANPVRLPEGMNLFPALLRKAGYHTANAAKTDYNCELDSTAWDIVRGKPGDWRKRADKGQNFFFVRTNAKCHESCLHFKDPAAVTDSGQTVRYMPQHPATDLFRKTYLKFYESIEKCDRELGRLLDMLREDGLADNTIVFCFGDNGGSLPGSKGYVSETGLRVPLAILIPEKWRKRWNYTAGTRVTGVVDFTDFAPTLLHLAGCDIPGYMDGTPFLGENIGTAQINAADETFGYADRFDELYAFCRTLRKGRFKYVRNFYPYAPASLMATYRYHQKAFVQWRDMFREGRLDSIGARFFLPQGTEALYDIETDAGETRNLAQDPAYADTLARMRGMLRRKMTDLHDVGLLPEYLLQRDSNKCPGEYGKRAASRLDRLMNLTDRQKATCADFEKDLADCLRDPDEAVRYWTAVNAIWFRNGLSKKARRILLKALSTEKAGAVRSKLLTLAVLTGEKTKVQFDSLLRTATSEAELLYILNDMALLHDMDGSLSWNLKHSALPFDSENIRWRLDYLFSTGN